MKIVLTLALGAGVILASGCPAHDQPIVITTLGAQSLTQACNRPCRDDGGVIAPTVTPGSCALPGHLPPEFSEATQARLFLVTPADNRVRDASKCMMLPRCRCGERASCLAEGLNQQLDGAIAKGLGFDDLKNPDDVELFVAFYQQQEFLEDTEESQPSCRRVDLVACAGLAPPLGGGGDYDMSCASCQGGPRNPPSRNNGPCPKDSNGSCFLEKCDSWLASNGYD